MDMRNSLKREEGAGEPGTGPLETLRRESHPRMRDHAGQRRLDKDWQALHASGPARAWH